jgi:chemotaxis protein methyltransferase CheR
LSKDNVDDLIAQMRTAVQNAKGSTAALNAGMASGMGAAASAPPVSAHARSETAMQLELVNQLMLGVETRFGIKPGTLVERKLVRILKEMPISVLRDWVNSMSTCSSEHPEWQSLVENLTVHETYFCRDPDLMDMLGKDILPNLIASREKNRQLQVWSGASSTGEEVYDLAYMCLRGLQKAGKARQQTDGRVVPEGGWSLSVMGSDVSNQALRTAREGVYGELGMGSFRNLPDHWRAMFDDVSMAPTNAMPGVRYHKVRDWVKNCVRFERFNLMNSRPPVQNMDLVFCRNVLIYFEDSVKRTVQTMLARSMSTGGVLVMGASVQMLVPDYFEQRLGNGGPWYVRNGVAV